MPDPNARRAREDIAPGHGRRLVVSCDKPPCEHAAIIEPRRLFGDGRHWPREGRSERFRCLGCGSRETMVRYTRNAAQANGPISRAAIALWC